MKNISVEPWGETAGGEAVKLFTLQNSKGMKAVLSDLGATLVHLIVPGLQGFSDVCLGLSTAREYESKSPYFGAVVGRYGNRIANGKFYLEGKVYRLDLNNRPNGVSCSLHGGASGFERRVWSAKPRNVDGCPAVAFSLRSPDGDQGYPGRLDIEITYVLTQSNSLRIQYSATTTKPTPLNLTNHAYFNLAGEGSGDVLDHLIQINSDAFLPTNPGQIPTGRLHSVAGTPFDFRGPHRIGSRLEADHRQLSLAGGYDHTYVLRSSPNGEPVLAATAWEPISRRRMDCYTDQIGVQFYTGNFMVEGSKGKAGKSYRRRGGFCLETQHFPDSPNHPEFPSTILRPGQAYHSVTEYCFSVDRPLNREF